MGKHLQIAQISLLLFLCFCRNQTSIAQNKSKWRIKNRLQVVYEFDNNIREVPQPLDRTEDSSLRFLFHSQAVRNSPKLRLVFGYRGGLQPYFENAIENKLINEFNFSAAFKLDKVVLGTRGAGRLKNYLNDVLDYATGSAELFFQFPAIARFGNEIAVTGSNVNYQNFSTFDYSEWQFKWKLWRKLSPRLTWSLEFAGKQISYIRTILETDIGQSVLPFVDVELDDHNYILKTQLNYSKSFLVNLSYTFQHNDSKIAQYTYYKHQFTLVFGFPLRDSVWLRGYGAAQFKDYRDDAFDFFPIDIDTEKEQSNFFVLDLSKDLNPGLTALVRLAYYNNESIERGRFYRKTLLTLGFDYRF